MDVSRDQQRVALENLSDWHQAKDDFASAAREKLEFKSTSLQPNERDAMLAHLNYFIDQTVALAQPNLRVNGRNFEDIDENEDLEQFDEALDRKIWSLADSRLALHQDLSATRRNVPKQLENSLTQLLEQESKLERHLVNEDNDVGVDREEGDVLQVRSSQIGDTFRKAIALGEELTQVVANQQERAQRFEVVAAEVKSLPP